MKLQDLRWALALAEDEQWNPGLNDWISYYALDPNGHFVMINPELPEDQEQRIGCISAVKYNSFAFIGLYIISPVWRGKGYGKALWEHAMKYIADSPQQGLYAVPKEVSRYKKQGFSQESVNRRFMRKVPKIYKEKSSAIVSFDAKSTAFSQVKTFDEQLFAAPRSQILSAMLTQSQTYGLAYLADDQVKGYCIIRPLMKGFRIGPLYSSDCDAAKELMTEAMRIIGKDGEVILNSSLENPCIKMFAEFFELEIVNEADLTAMFKGGEPGKLMENRGKRYAELSLEVG